MHVQHLRMTAREHAEEGAAAYMETIQSKCATSTCLWQGVSELNGCSHQHGDYCRPRYVKKDRRATVRRSCARRSRSGSDCFKSGCMSSSSACQRATRLKGRSCLRILFQPQVRDEHQHVTTRRCCEKRRCSVSARFNAGCETTTGI